ncbi:hypothetical protein EYC80_011000 [Monilinia laxa]|uniref:Uncharacterized protein n=1 Tax=Monilinia laxa TaxID=61186 RepID=A0A5N6JRF0_MONLA|nr:hypothetical protein EYC80_011000 [Monilinia laxa]
MLQLEETKILDKFKLALVHANRRASHFEHSSTNLSTFLLPDTRHVITPNIQAIQIVKDRRRLLVHPVLYICYAITLFLSFLGIYLESHTLDLIK